MMSPALENRAETLPAHVWRVLRDQQGVLDTLAGGPVSGRGLADRMGCRWARVCLATRMLEAEGAVERTARTGRGARWVLRGRPFAYTSIAYVPSETFPLLPAGGPQ